MIFEVPKKPYDEEKFYAKKELEIKSNTITCLLGCNGSGKTTLIHIIVENLRKYENAKEVKLGYIDFSFLLNEKPTNVHYCIFDKHANTCKDEGDYYKQCAISNTISTGEDIVNRFGNVLGKIGKTIHDISWQKDKDKPTLFLFFDDCDAGSSIDNIMEIKKMFKMIASDCEKWKITYYIIFTANSYELCKEFDNISVHNFKPVKITTYDSFKRFVLKSRNIKDKRFEKEDDK